MNLTIRATRRILGGTALLCAAAMLPGTALAATAAPAKVMHAQAGPAKAGPDWNIRRCLASQTVIWLGLGNGGGTAGTIFRPLEFSNVSRHTCKLQGFPWVAGLGRHGHKIGKAARRLGHHTPEVILQPGETAHAQLGFIKAGNVCRHPVTAFALKVRAPHQGRATVIPFEFQTCRHKRTLVVGPVQPGVGIP